MELSDTQFPDFVIRLYGLLKDYPLVFFFCVHMSVGRTVSCLTGLWLLHLPPVELLGFAWIGDMLNIPFFVTVYNTLSRGLRLSPRLTRWFDRAREARERHRLYSKLARMGPIGVMLLAALPFWGCGMWSSILLAWSMKMPRAQGTTYLAVGSFLGGVLIIALGVGAKEVVRLF